MKEDQVWGCAGSKYEVISRSYSDVIERAVDRVASRNRNSVLDLACGTGITARTLAKRNGRLSIVGVDFSSRFIEVAKKFAVNENLNIRFQWGDMQALPFADSSFDAIVSTFGISFSSDPEAVSKELIRVSRRGASLVFTVWRRDRISRGLNLAIAHGLGAPSPSTLKSEWEMPSSIRKMLGRHFTLEFEKGVSHWRLPDAESAWGTWTTSYGPIKALVSSLSARKVAKLKGSVLSYLSRFESKRGFSYPRAYLLVHGIRSGEAQLGRL